MSGLGPEPPTSAGGALFFAAGDADGEELWCSDGTPRGTARVADIAPGPASAAPADLTAARDRLYFTATTAATGRELWMLDAAAGCGRVEPSCRGDADCDDRDGCTSDTCDPGAGCAHAPVAEVDATAFVLATAGGVCPDGSLPRPLAHGLTRVRASVVRAASATRPRDVHRRLGAAIRRLERLRRRLERGKDRGTVGTACRAALGDFLTGARARAAIWSRCREERLRAG